jgi:hypothetical protein
MARSLPTRGGGWLSLGLLLEKIYASLWAPTITMYRSETALMRVLHESTWFRRTQRSSITESSDD